MEADITPAGGKTLAPDKKMVNQLDPPMGIYLRCPFGAVL